MLDDVTDPQKGDYLEFEVVADDYQPYVTKEGMGHVAGAAYTDDYCFVVRGHSCKQADLETGTYRAMVTNTVIANQPVENGDSSRILFVNMAKATYLGKRDSVLFDFRRDLFNVNEYLPSIVHGMNELWYSDMSAAVIMESDGIDDDHQVIQLVPGPANKMIPLDEWEERTKHGCASCTGNLTVETAINIDWMDGITPLCMQCSLQREIDILT